MLVAARSVSPRTVEEREKAMAASAAESHRTARRALPLTRGRAGYPPLLRVGGGGLGARAAWGCGGRGAGRRGRGRRGIRAKRDWRPARNTAPHPCPLAPGP